MAVYTAIDDAGSFFNSKLFTGTGSSLAVTGVGFQPDFTWIKNRDAADFHVLTDAVRLATKYVICNANTSETTDTESLKSFDSDGFTVGTQAEVNTNTEDYVSWNWKAGTTTGIAGSPSITPSGYSFNATSGFSVIAYTGTGSAATLPHGLGVAPKLILFKQLSGSDNWAVYSNHIGATEYLTLDQTAAASANSSLFNDTEPTSTVFTVGSSGRTNTSSATYIAYCFADVQGYSKFGTYTGNGNADGTFVYTGFRPAFTLVKQTDATNNWGMCDNKRNQNSNTEDNGKGNYTPHTLVTNAAGAESSYGSGTSNLQDYLSNGFKFRDSNPYGNSSGSPYIYWAFAESPFVNSEGVPVNAR